MDPLEDNFPSLTYKVFVCGIRRRIDVPTRFDINQTCHGDLGLQLAGGSLPARRGTFWTEKKHWDLRDEK